MKRCFLRRRPCGQASHGTPCVGLIFRGRELHPVNIMRNSHQPCERQPRGAQNSRLSIAPLSCLGRRRPVHRQLEQLTTAVELEAIETLEHRLSVCGENLIEDRTQRSFDQSDHAARIALHPTIVHSPAFMASGIVGRGSDLCRRIPTMCRWPPHP